MGQSGYTIYAPVMGLFRVQEPVRSDDVASPDATRGSTAGEVVRSKMVNVVLAYVWDVSQTTGVEIPNGHHGCWKGEAPGLWTGLADPGGRQIASPLADAAGAAEIMGANG